MDETKRMNLRKLTSFLEDNYFKLNFDMHHFMKIKNIDGTFRKSLYVPDEEEQNRCDMVACAAGFGPMAGVPSLKDEEWIDYVYRVFIDDMNEYMLIENQELKDGAVNWQFLFSPGWKEYDNTPLGAAARIRYFLDHEDTIEKYGYSYDKELYEGYLKPPVDDITG